MYPVGCLLSCPPVYSVNVLIIALYLLHAEENTAALSTLTPGCYIAALRNRIPRNLIYRHRLLAPGMNACPGHWEGCEGGLSPSYQPFRVAGTYAGGVATQVSTGAYDGSKLPHPRYLMFDTWPFDFL